MARNKRKSYEAEVRADGMACPNCGCRHFETVTEKVGETVRRVRRCRHCGRPVPA